MELIDRKPFVEYANEQITGTFAYPQGHKVEDEKAYREKWEFVRNVLMSAPIVEAEPIKHGKWINDKGLYKCSVCNEFTITGWANCIPIEQMNKTMKYCNNCGAKMDGREDD